MMPIALPSSESEPINRPNSEPNSGSRSVSSLPASPGITLSVSNLSMDEPIDRCCWVNVWLWSLRGGGGGEGGGGEGGGGEGGGGEGGNGDGAGTGAGAASDKMS